MASHKEQILRFYRKFAPSHRVDVDKLLKKYKGNESVLLSEIYMKYLVADKTGGGTQTPFEDVVAHLYTRYAPNKSEGVRGLAQKYQNRQAELIIGIVNKYEFHDAPKATGSFGDKTFRSTVSAKTKLTDIYRTANPAKVETVDALLKKYKGKEDALVRAVTAKYKPSASSSTSSSEAFKMKLSELYRKHDPAKIGLVDNLAIKYKGNQAGIIAAIGAKYHPKRTELVHLYTKYNPSKVNDVDQLLTKYQGHEDELIRQVKERYEALKDSKTQTPPPAYTTHQGAPEQHLAAKAASERPPESIDITREAERLRAQQEAEAKRIAQDEADRKAREEVQRKAAADLAAKQQAAKVIEAAEQKRKQEAAASSTKKSVSAKPKKQNLTTGQTKKKMNITPIIVIVVCLGVLGGGGGAYYYKFGLTLPFFDKRVDAKEESANNASLAVTSTKEEKEEAAGKDEGAVDDLAVGEKETTESPEEDLTEEPEVPEAAAEDKGLAKSEPEPIEPSVAKAKPVDVAIPPVGKNLMYHLAAGSFSVEENARALQKQLKSQGYESVYLGRIGGYYKVSYQSFKTEAEARAALATLKDKGVSSWMMKHELK